MFGVYLGNVEVGVNVDVQGVPEKAGTKVCVRILKHTSCTLL